MIRARYLVAAAILPLGLAGGLGIEAREPAAVPAAAALVPVEAGRVPAMPDASPSGIEAARAGLAASRGGAETARALRALEAETSALRDRLAGIDAEVETRAFALRREEGDIKRLMAALASAARAGLDAGDLPTGPGARAIHPDGPEAASRAAALAVRAAAALATDAGALAARIDALEAARRLQQEGGALVAAALGDAEAAREDLRRAAASADPMRAGPPGPDSRTGALVASSATLSDLARRVAGTGGSGASSTAVASAETAVAALARLPVGAEADVTRSTRSAVPAPLEQPVAGRVLRAFDVADAGGVAQPGLTFAAAPRAIVTAPGAGEVRFVGPFLDYNRVVILALDGGETVLLAGLAETVVEPGARIERGAALGLLGGRVLEPQEYLMLPAEGNDPLGAETLYMELWRAGRPVDPGPLLATG